MFSDPQTITYATVAKPLPKIGFGDDSSVYRLNDGVATFRMQLSHAFGKRNRAVARLSREVYVADPLTSGNSVVASHTATLTMDFPTVGVSPEAARDLGVALTTYLTSANLLRLANGET